MSRPPVSLWELRQAQHRLREHGRRALDEPSIFEAIREQRHIIEQAKKTSRARRKREKLIGLARAERINPEQAGTSEPEDLKSFEVEEWY